ncbi:MAG: hypothetical protein H7A21_09660 [Spirochaetales bacterium]|nr:hypothetical protein [Leptospiraceae bacterium]MCP5481688.1 hypothetical protein [Spirochaetales bacterium]
MTVSGRRRLQRAISAVEEFDRKWFSVAGERETLDFLRKLDRRDDHKKR